MKKIIFVLLLILSTCLTAQAQKETVVRYGATDVILTLDKGESLNMTFVRSASGTDTLQVYAVFSNPYRESLLGGVNQADRSVSTTLIVTNSPKTYNFSTAGAPKIVVKMLDVDSSVVLISYAVGNSTLGFRSDPASLYTLPGVWTAPQTFETMIANLLVVNNIDSTQSIRLYDTSGTLYALFSSDTSWIPNLTVGNLNSTTIINGSSVTTNSLISDTIIGNSPIDLIADTVRVQNKFFAKYGIFDSTKSSKVIIGGHYFYDYDASRVGLSTNLILSGTNNYINGLRIGNLLPYSGSSFTIQTNALPQSDTTYNLGIGTNRWRTTYTRTLNADSVRTGHSIFMSTVTEPASPTTGQIYYNGTNWFGWNGTAWKQFDN